MCDVKVSDDACQTSIRSRCHMCVRPNRFCGYFCSPEITSGGVCMSHTLATVTVSSTWSRQLYCLYIRATQLWITQNAPEFCRSSCERPTEGNRKERHKVINVRGELHKIQIEILIRLEKIKGKPNNYTRSPQGLKKPADLMKDHCKHKRTKKEKGHFFMVYTSGSISEGVRKMGNWLDSQWLLYPRCLAAGTIASRAICCCLQMKTSSFCQHA